jgi:hypothetical protein
MLWTREPLRWSVGGGSTTPGASCPHLGIQEFANKKLITTMSTDAPITDALG